MTRDQRVEDTTPGSGQDELDSSDVVVGVLGVDSPEGDGWGNDGNEEEAGYGDGLGVEVGHFLDPPGTDGALEISDDSASECLGRDWSIVATGLRRVTFNDRFISQGASRASSGLPVAESWHDEGSKIEIKFRC